MLGIIQTDAGDFRPEVPANHRRDKRLRPAKPVIFAGLDEGAVVPEPYMRRLRALDVPCFVSPERALRAVARVSALGGRDVEVSADDAAVAVPDGLPNGIVAEFRAKELLAPLGIPFPRGGFVMSDEARRTGGVDRLPGGAEGAIGGAFPQERRGRRHPGSADPGGARRGWRRLHDDIARHRPDVALEGVLVETMADRGVEIIVGGRNDPEWGPVVLAGFGGVQAELLEDLRLLPPDLTVPGIVRELSR